MKVDASFAALAAILASGLFSEMRSLADPAQHPIEISPTAAEKLLLHKVEVCYPPGVYSARVIGTVVVAIGIDKDGNVLHPIAVSGPAMLQASVIDAVQKYYKYKPYLLEGKAVEVETTVAVFVGLQCKSPTPYWIH